MSEFSSSHQVIFHFIFEYRSFFVNKASEIRKQRLIQNAFTSTNKSKFSRGRSPEPPLREGGNPTRVLSPSPALDLGFAGPLLRTRRRPCFPKRIKYHKALMVYKSLNGLAPDYLANLFTKISEKHSRNLRSVTNDDLAVPFAKTNYFQKSFSVEGANIWNSLPTDIKQIQNINTFKLSLRSHLLNDDS